MERVAPWGSESNIHHVLRWDQASNKWTDLGYRGGAEYETPYAIDTKRNRMLRLANYNLSATTYALNKGAANTDITLTGPAAGSARGHGQLVYDSAADVFWFWRRDDATSTLYRIHPETWEATIQDVSGEKPRNDHENSIHNTYGRFNFVPEMRGLVFMRDHNSNVYFIRTAP